MSVSDWDKFATDNAPFLAQIINKIPVGIWELNIDHKEFIWSAGFYTILGYEPGEIPCTYDYFFDHFLFFYCSSKLHASAFFANWGFTIAHVSINKSDLR